MKPGRSEFLLKRMSLASQPLEPASRVRFSTEEVSECKQAKPPNFMAARNSLITKRVEFSNQGDFTNLLLNHQFY